MNHPDLSEYSQTQRERLHFIDFRLYFLARINRNDLISRFGIKEAAATRDISAYRELRPNNAVYEYNDKEYKKGPGFDPLFNYNAKQVLSALSEGIGDDFVGIHKSLVYCDTPTQLSYPDVEILSVLTNAIALEKPVVVEYHSLSSGMSKRELVPFVLVDNGLRWHIRGYDRKRQRFGDFVLTRITKAEMVDKAPADHEKRDADDQWNRVVDLEIVPHPSNLEYPGTIELDYKMTNGSLRVKVRAAVAGYVLRRWNVDCSTNHSLHGKEYHLWLKNTLALYGVDNLSIAPGYKAVE